MPFHCGILRHNHRAKRTLILSCAKFYGIILQLEVDKNFYLQNVFSKKNYNCIFLLSSSMTISEWCYVNFSYVSEDLNLAWQLVNDVMWIFHMWAKIWISIGRIAAILTRKWFLSCMYHDMPFDSLCVFHYLWAKRTRVLSCTKFYGIILQNK